MIEPRGIEGKRERFPGLAAELVRLQLDVIVAAGGAVPALKQATSAIPIVMAAAADPVGSGYVLSLGHPGGNVTGLSLQSVETTGKRLEMLKEIVPAATPVAVLWDRTTLGYWQAAEAAPREQGWKLLSLEIRDAGERPIAPSDTTSAPRSSGAYATVIESLCTSSPTYNVVREWSMADLHGRDVPRAQGGSGPPTLTRDDRWGSAAPRGSHPV